jgi:hypothetical protein
VCVGGRTYNLKACSRNVVLDTFQTIDSDQINEAIIKGVNQILVSCPRAYTAKFVEKRYFLLQDLSVRECDAVWAGKHMYLQTFQSLPVPSSYGPSNDKILKKNWS